MGLGAEWNISLFEFEVYGIQLKSRKTVIDWAEKSLSEEITIFPNPTSTTLTITGDPGLARIEIYSQEGRKVYETTGKISFPHQVDISSYTPGVYIIKVSNGNDYFMEKMIK